MSWTRTRVRAGSTWAERLEAQRGTLLLWMPVALGLGAIGYFSLRFEPGLRIYLGAGLGLGLTLGLILWWPWRIKAGLLAIMLVLAGFINAGFSAHHAAAPVLRFHYYGPVVGRIIAVDRSAKDKPRITLDQVFMPKLSPHKIPDKVRISLYYPRQHSPLKPGRRVMLTANLSPLSGPVEPGGFDFQRYAWFRDLGAIGYSRNPVLEVRAPDNGGPGMWLASLRMRLAAEIAGRIDGQKGAFAAAILTGDRARISPSVLETLRQSNLAHLLAISGMHMGMLTGFFFAMIRYGLALIPAAALRLPVKKVAAVAAMGAATAYLGLSGANIATQRAYVMVIVMLLAVLLDRRALSLRAVALAAVIVLILRPVSVIEAGFQMSFAATTALVAVFASLRGQAWLTLSGRGFWRGLLRAMLTLALSSAIAGLATAPISAFHFNRVAQFGLLANLASVPAMGFVVMPAAVVAVLLTPFSLAAPFWAAMGAGIQWILTVAAKIASLDGSVRHILKPEGIVLGLICLGALAIVLLRGRLRFIGLAPVLLGFALWVGSTRPDILLSANGRIMGVLGPEGRQLNRTKGNGFVAMSWLENDGDPADQAKAAARKVPSLPLVYDWSKTPAEDLPGHCRDGWLVILPQAGPVDGDCQQITKEDLRTTGAIAIRRDGDRFNITSARQSSGQRLWTGPP